MCLPCSRHPHNPTQTPTQGWMRLYPTASYAARQATRQGGSKDVYEANRYEQGGNILGARAPLGRGGGLVDQHARPLGLRLCWRVVYYSRRGGLGHAASSNPRWLLQGRLEIPWPPPSGPERL